MEFKLIIKRINGSLSAKEEEIFDHWYNDSIEHRNYFERIKENYHKSDEVIDIEEGWEKVYNTIRTEPKKIYYWKYIAASFILICLTSTFFITNKNVDFFNKKTAALILPGRDRAVLTLADGSKVVLEKGQKFETKNSISNGEKLIYHSTDVTNPKVEYNYLTVPRGGQFFVEIEDGTKIWLNSESKLKYPKSFGKGKDRKVELIYGEAYFDVSSNTNHKGSVFKVFSGNQEIEVLGTEFNIKAYNDEEFIYTTLVEGKVALFNKETRKILSPNQQSIISIQRNDITVKNVDVYNETAWREGVFSFENKPLKGVMKVLSRWYDMEVSFENKSLETVQFIGVLGKEQNIEDILIMIKELEVINSYKIKGKKVVLK